MRLRIGDRVLDIPSAAVIVTLVESRGRPRIELELPTVGGSRVLYVRPGQSVVFSDTVDFRPGDQIVGPRGERYTVRDPVRTRRGYLRVRGPLGGQSAYPWRLDHLPPGYRLDDDRG